MPTAARLMAAICLAVTAYVISLMVMPLMPESTDFGYFVPLNIVLGLVVGWVVMGPRAGRGATAAVNNGLAGVFVLMFWGVGIQSAYEMFRLAMRHRYDGPSEAIIAIFTIGAEYVTIIATIPIGVALLVAALISGVLTDVADRYGR
ncbi:Tellurite resistance protein [Sulfitobacter noctilucae]|uniref:TrgA family protein n=1 Tax=Sulfitobacter noctilucae TaxID=1342302 RepID=UPI00046949FB|nr:TrgA family protein [Sulfitobacter noctilucae]KIN61172.1 Tellurite resistance protein [Sulfitobacter noctilucae]